MYRGGGKVGRKAKKPYNVKHGMRNTRTYKSWDAAKQRCHNPNSAKYYMYGAKGVIVCDEWRKDFSSFFEYMGERPENTSLDRWPNPNGNYEPGNCRWATIKEQRKNRRHS